MTPQEAQQISALIAQAGTVGTAAFAALTRKILVEGIGDAVITVVLTAVLVLMGLGLWRGLHTDRGVPGEVVFIAALAGGLVLMLALYFGASAVVEIGAPDGVAVERILRAVHQ